MNKSTGKTKKSNKGKTIALFSAIGMVIVCVVVVVAWQPWRTDAGGIVASEALPPFEVVSAVNDDNDNSQQIPEVEIQSNDQTENYMSIGEEGTINRDNYETDEEYMAALISSGARQIDVPDEVIWEDEDNGYVMGTLVVHFYSSCGEDRAREIINELGGLWVSDTFAWPSTWENGDADVEAYFPDAPYKEQLQLIADNLKNMDEVSSAYVTSVGNDLDDLDSSAITAADAIELSVSSETNDPHLGMQYWLTSSRLDEAWDIVCSLGTVEVAVFDTGIDLDHPDLAANIVADTAYDAYHKIALQGDNQDTSGHGTMVAGVISAVADNSIGIAGSSYNAKVVPVRVTSSEGSVDWRAVERAFAFVFSLKNTPEAINMSFGKTSFDDSAQEERLQTLVDRARDDYRIACVASAGNDGMSGNTVKYPAAFKGVLAVGAIDENGDLCDFSTRNKAVSLVAAGENILTTANPDYANGELYTFASGTSLAAPQVASSAALLKAKYPVNNAVDVECAMVSTAISMPGENSITMRSDEYGYGALDAQAACALIRAKTVAYLYAIDKDGTAYFFTPGASDD